MHADAGMTVPESAMNCVEVSSGVAMSGSDDGSPMASSYFLTCSSKVPWYSVRTTTLSWLSLYCCASFSRVIFGRPMSECHIMISTGPSADSSAS